MKKIFMAIAALFMSVKSQAMDLKEGDAAPLFNLKNQDGKDFSLSSRKGQWTVLYFYPKSETPGCTKQACAFRDGIQKIRQLKADVIGISVNSVADQAEFKKNHQLNFELLADEKGEVTKLYGAKMPVANMAKRWTFIIDPDLKVRAIDKDVDPVKDVERVSKKLQEFQSSARQ